MSVRPSQITRLSEFCFSSSKRMFLNQSKQSTRTCNGGSSVPVQRNFAFEGFEQTEDTHNRQLQKESLKQVTGSTTKGSSGASTKNAASTNEKRKVPWYPKCIEDLDLIGEDVIDIVREDNKDHLQFTDPPYRKRREMVANIARKFKIGDSIPNIDFQKEEVEMWVRIYKTLRNIHASSASERYEYNMSKLNRIFKFDQRMPQLSQLSQHLKEQTGFTLKPVNGLLSQREFLNSFAFRVFNCTQFLRHPSVPDNTPEPDTIHEIVGHIPMFADPTIADFSQKIGLFSLGASDQQIAQLGNLYWYTLQFGGCLQNGKIKAYGAAIISSIEEFSHFISKDAQFSSFVPEKDCNASYQYDTVQECYRVVDSFEKTFSALQAFGKNLNKRINLRFDSKNQRVEQI